MILKTISVDKFFKQGEGIVHILNNISVSFEQGKTYALTGPSGSGKTTLMHLLAGLENPDKGCVWIDDVMINGMNDEQRRIFLNKTVGFVFQQPYLIRELTVIENVMLKGLIAGNSYDACFDQAHSLLHKVQLSHKATHSPMSLSGGEQQRVALARALFNKPHFLLADEPTGNLDVHTGMLIVDLILACQSEWGMGVIVSSHDEYVAGKMGRVFRLENGQLTTE